MNTPRTRTLGWVAVFGLLLLPCGGFAWEPDDSDLEAAIARGEFVKVEARRPFLAWVMKSAPIMDLWLEAAASTAGTLGDIDIGALERWHKFY